MSASVAALQAQRAALQQRRLARQRQAEANGGGGSASLEPAAASAATSADSLEPSSSTATAATLPLQPQPAADHATNSNVHAATKRPRSEEEGAAFGAASRPLARNSSVLEGGSIDSGEKRPRLGNSTALPTSPHLNNGMLTGPSSSSDTAATAATPAATAASSSSATHLQPPLAPSSFASRSSSSSTTTTPLVVGSLLSPPPVAPVYNPSLNIPAASQQQHVPQHWRAHETSHSLMQDLSQHFVNRGSVADRPSNFIRDEAADGDRTNGDPEYATYVARRTEVVTSSNQASAYMAKRFDLAPYDGPDGPGSDLMRLLGCDEGFEFDVVLIDPPWQEYKDRTAASASGEGGSDSANPNSKSTTPLDPHAASLLDRVWSGSDLSRLPIARLTGEPSLVFLWCGNGRHLTEGRDLLRHWGFDLAEDIIWLRTNKRHPRTPGYMNEENSIFQGTVEHCLLGIKGREWVLRDRDLKNIPYDTRMDAGMVQFVHPGTEIDCIISEGEEYGSTSKPDGLYDLIDRYCDGRRRLELFGTEHNLRHGWLTLGLELSAEVDNFDGAEYRRRFERPPPPPPPATTINDTAAVASSSLLPFDARVGGAYVPFDAESERLRPKSPPSSMTRARPPPRRRRRGWRPMHLASASNQTASTSSPPLQPLPLPPPPPPPPHEEEWVESAHLGRKQQQPQQNGHQHNNHHHHHPFPSHPPSHDETSPRTVYGASREHAYSQSYARPSQPPHFTYADRRARQTIGHTLGTRTATHP